MWLSFEGCGFGFRFAVEGAPAELDALVLDGVQPQTCAPRVRLELPEGFEQLWLVYVAHSNTRIRDLRGA